MSDPTGAAQITNTLFPPPPEYYKRYTDANVARHDTLSTPGAGPSRSPAVTSDGRQPVSAEGSSEGLADLQAELRKPRADWIREDGRWVTFGEMHLTTPHIPTPADIGLTPLFDPDDPTSLKPLLHSFLHTLLRLVDTLTNSARPPHELAERGWAHEGDQYIQHMTNISANLMVAANQLRAPQAESTLVLLMERQLSERRKQTEALRSKCRAIAVKLQSIRSNPNGIAPLLVLDEVAMDAA